MKSAGLDAGPPEPKETAAPKAPAKTFRIGEKAAATATRIPPPPTGIAMDKRSYLRMRRGKAEPEARIDLHGMTAAAAHTALIGFVMRAHGEGKRLLLVITGKGRGGDDDNPIPTRRGILRQQVPHWLDLPPLASLVLQVSEANRRHGGSGALYVYLRRR